MKVVYKKRFLRELVTIPNAYRQRIERFVFEQLPASESLEETGRCERLKAHPGFYKARFGRYRVGLRRGKHEVVLERVLDRRDIYRKFP